MPTALYQYGNTNLVIIFNYKGRIDLPHAVGPAAHEVRDSLLNNELYTRYPIVARRAWPLGRVRRASKGIFCMQDTFARATHSA